MTSSPGAHTFHEPWRTTLVRTGSIALAIGVVVGMPWWIGGVGFVVLELFVHLFMRLRAIPSFYDGRG